MSKIKKRLFIILPAIAVLLCTALYSIGNYMLSYAMAPIPCEHAPDSPNFNNESTANNYSSEIDKIANQHMEKDRLWLQSVSTIEKTQSFDGLNLNAYCARHGMNSPFSDTKNWAIFMHGYKDNPGKMSPYAHHFFDKGFNILVPGQRGHGWSDGNLIDMGYYSSLDVKSWISKILEKNKNAKIMLYGVSMGAATIMMTTGNSLPDNVVCVVEDCGYTSVWEQFAYQLKQQFSLPEFPVLYASSALCKAKYGFAFKDASPINSVHNSKTPTLFIHGSADTYVPFEMHERLFNAASCPKEKLIIERAVHARSAWTDPQKYWNAVDRFTDNYFKSDSTTSATGSM